MSKKLGFSSQIFTGLIIIFIGILLLLSTTNLYDTSQIWKFVPSLFILLGIYSIIQNRFKNITGAALLIVFAAIFQLIALDVVDAATAADWWPLFIIILGLFIIINRFKKTPMIEKDQLSLLAILGGNEARSTSSDLKGGEITAILGGVTLDLRDAKIESKPIKLNLLTILGGVDLKIPGGWNIKNNVSPILGGIEDKRRAIETSKEVDVVIEGILLLGGVTIVD